MKLSTVKLKTLIKNRDRVNCQGFSWGLTRGIIVSGESFKQFCTRKGDYQGVRFVKRMKL